MNFSACFNHSDALGIRYQMSRQDSCLIDVCFSVPSIEVVVDLRVRKNLL